MFNVSTLTLDLSPKLAWQVSLLSWQLQPSSWPAKILRVILHSSLSSPPHTPWEDFIGSGFKIHAQLLSHVWRLGPLGPLVLLGFSVRGILQAGMLEWAALPPPGDRPDPEMEPGSPASLALVGGYFLTAPPGLPVCLSPVRPAWRISSLTWEAAAAPSGCPHLSPERLRRLPQAALPLSLPPLLPSFILKAGARVSLKSGSEHVTPQILIAQRPQSVGSLGLQWLALSVMFLTSFSTSLPPALLASHTGFSDAPQTRQNYTSGCLC